MGRSREAALHHGRASEARVVHALQAGGWTILARNWRGGGGELDVVATKEGRLRFVEVKARAELERESITPGQVRRLRQAASAWLIDDNTPYAEVCFALVEVQPGGLTWTDDPF